MTNPDEVAGVIRQAAETVEQPSFAAQTERPVHARFPSHRERPNDS
jgi:hypothetical protein